ncbi:hypothetical protein NDU88_003135 [Pleurodeles waltl]|uniref:Uncharacterized protein n=1 Tax=Pleurodeles waltl TaxID=8319 RepID=A0AAV7P8N6_PLEWA|nr:hypothetical protein NDU88_003135 [Pleurodeles waltl]
MAHPAPPSVPIGEPVQEAEDPEGSGEKHEQRMPTLNLETSAGQRAPNTEKPRHRDSLTASEAGPKKDVAE